MVNIFKVFDGRGRRFVYDRISLLCLVTKFISLSNEEKLRHQYLDLPLFRFHKNQEMILSPDICRVASLLTIPISTNLS